MRSIGIFFVVGVATIASGLFAYSMIISDEPMVQSPRAMRSPDESIARLEGELGDRLDNLTRAFELYQRSQQAQLREALSLQAGLGEKLSDLDRRLQSVETAARAASNYSARDQVERDTRDGDEDVAEVDRDDDGRVAISEAQFGRWMDDSLELRHSDRQTTVSASEEVLSNLDKAPGVMLEDMKCGDAFCRAVFAHEDGETPEIGGLIGEPPFLTDGFTVIEPDGRVLVYFALEGESLDELRGEAGESVLN